MGTERSGVERRGAERSVKAGRARIGSIRNGMAGQELAGQDRRLRSVMEWRWNVTAWIAMAGVERIASESRGVAVMGTERHGLAGEEW